MPAGRQVFGVTPVEQGVPGDLQETAPATRALRLLVAAGTLLAAAAVAQPVLAWFVDGHWAAGLAAMMLAELVTGREAAYLLALHQGVPPLWIAATSILQNLALAALLAPAAEGSWRWLTRSRWGTRLRDRLQDTASRNPARPWSALGIFAFMLVPFLANGAVVAALLGRWAGIPWRRLVPAVVAGVVVTATLWAFAYHVLQTMLEAVHPAVAALPAALALVVVAVVAVRWLWKAWPRRTASDPGQS